MKITYINHSGFLIEFEDCYLIFDYYNGSVPKLDVQKQVIVFASHAHTDHYNPDIFTILRKQGVSDENIYAVLSYDIYERKIPQDLKKYIRVKYGQTYELPHNIRLQTLHSTDRGVAFLLFTGEGTIYHAGDLNDWIWEGESKQYNNNMTARYRREIDTIKGLSVDAAFLPLDSRQNEDAFRGMKYFLDNVNVKNAFPMHYWEDCGVIGRFTGKYPQYSDIVIDTSTLGHTWFVK